MTDIMSPAQRHRCMSHIRSRNTKPELKVRQWLWNHGYHYRLCVKGVPGKPDIVMRKYRTAIFVNGCFWHGHGVETVHAPSLQFETGNGKWEIRNSTCCKIPKTNRDFWLAKIQRNQERDERNYQILRENGWQVIVLWECQLKANLLEDTMRQVEVALQDNYLRTFSHKAKTYILVDEENLPMAAEDTIEYN